MIGPTVKLGFCFCTRTEHKGNKKKATFSLLEKHKPT